MLEKYSAHRKRILSIFNQLHAVGCVVSSCVCVFSDVCHTSAQSDLELPRVVVIGNQSAGKWHSALNNASWDSYTVEGKSSVVEAISGVCHQSRHVLL